MASISEFVAVKRVSKGALSINEKVIILNVYNAIKHQNPTTGVAKIVETCSKMTGVGVSTIYRLSREEKSGLVNAPRKSTGRKKIVIEDDEETAIRRLTHSFYFEKQIPTLDKIMAEMQKDENIPSLSKTTLWRVLRKMNFGYEKLQNRKSLLVEKDEIICWRRRYLRAVRKYRRDNVNIYYLDETWLNEGYTVGKIWQDKNITSSRQAFLEGWSTGIKAPSGKGKRLIITHIGSKNGFVKGGLLAFQSKKTGDYHEDMNADVFEEYFGQMLDLIPPQSVIVMDNATYHSRKLEKVPTSSWRKSDIIQWLTLKEISHEGDMIKKELLEIVNLNKPPYTKYVIDEMALKKNITVLRLPPYHCELNPIELVWAQVKGFVAKRNTTFKLKDVESIFQEALKQVDSEKWSKCVEHVIKEEARMWELDRMVDETIEPLIISLDPNDDSTTDYSEDE